MISKEEVLHTAKLAKLSLTEEEIPQFQKDLSSIFDMIKQLQEVDTTGILPTSQVTGVTNVFREDVPEECSFVNELLKCTPHSVENHCIKTPKTI